MTVQYTVQVSQNSILCFSAQLPKYHSCSQFTQSTHRNKKITKLIYSPHIVHYPSSCGWIV